MSTLADPGNLHPRGGGLGGDQIGLNGGTIKIRPERIVTNFVQPIIESSRYAVRFPAFKTSRLVYGSFTIVGFYPDEVQHDALKVMFEGTVLNDVQILLAGGRGYSGTVVVRRVSPTWAAGDGNKDKNVPYNIECQFSGTLAILSESFSFSETESGEILTDLRKDWFAQVGYQDERADLISRPYIITGVHEPTTDPYDALGLVIGSLGGAAHTYKGLSLLKGTARSAGYGIVTGTLQYGLGPWDCSPASPIISIGFVDDLRRENPSDVIGSESGSSVCDQNPITVIPNVKVRVPLRVYRWPGVWASEPEPGPVGYINDADYTFPNGTVVPARELRWDEVDVRPTRAQGVTKYSGFLQFTRRDGGWIRGQIICIGYEQVQGGEGTLPSYRMVSGFRTVYSYARATFPTLATYIPICYGE